MIRINLLPFRLARRKENIRRQISIFVLLIFLTGVILFWISMYMNKKIQVVKDDTKQVNAEIAKYKEKAQRVEKIKKDLEALEEKLKIVISLNARRDQQLVLFDTMTQLVVPDRMWLSNFKADSSSVKIQGIAWDNPTIAEFMERLEKSPLFSKVDLKTAEMKKFKGGVTLKSFELVCQKTKEKKPDTQASKKQGKK